MKPFIYINNFALPTYGLLVLTGFVAGVVFMVFNAKHRNISKLDAFLLSLFCIIGALIGAYLLYIVLMLPDIINCIRINRTDLVRAVVFSGGLVYYGGVAGGFSGFYFYTSKYRINKTDSADIIAPSLSLGHVFGRIGCFFAGCCYGVESERFGIAFSESPIAPNGIKLLPVPLYEAAAEVLIAAISYFLMRKSKKGSAVFSYLLLYPAFRFIIEFWRGDKYRGIFFGLSTSQWISIFVFTASLLTLIFKSLKSQTKVEDRIEK
ncbi:MAG: prolipoprotein diacylglyceryl transferase [Ruminococcaceae bacterium]|nr:prolipoprotein diacylglyceryl transferase [Oscillospiraceae bacterium]